MGGSVDAAERDRRRHAGLLMYDVVTQEGER
jgi:hypothetical protein